MTPTIALALVIVSGILYTAIALGLKRPWAKAFGFWALGLTLSRVLLIGIPHLLDEKYDPMGTLMRYFAAPLVLPESMFLPFILDLKHTTQLARSLWVAALIPAGSAVIAAVIVFGLMARKKPSA